MNTITILPEAWRQAKWTFVTRRIRREDAVRLDDAVGKANPGDLLLARVEHIGQHKRVQLANGRFSGLYTGDLIIVATGARYAPDQFEGLAKIDPAGADLLAGGGIAGKMRCRNARIAPATRVAPIGLLADATGRIINLDHYALAPKPMPAGLITIGAIGTSMNSGKTTAAASLAHGLTRAGHRVAALKVTGTGACGDFNAYLDAGADFVADFTDVGMPTTYRQPLARIGEGMATLLGHASAAGCQVAVVEIADGLLQRETAAFLREPQLCAALDGMVFAAPDAMGAAGGVTMLRALGLAPDVLTGTVSLSPLGAAEAEEVTGLSVTRREELCDPAYASALMARLGARTAAQTSEIAA